MVRASRLRVTSLERREVLELVWQKPHIGFGIATSLCRKLNLAISLDADVTEAHLEGSFVPQSVEVPYLN